MSSRNAIHPFRAGGTIAPSRFVKLSTAADHRVLQGSANARCVGISQSGMKGTPGLAGSDITIAAEAGDPIEVFGFGDTALLEVGSGGLTHGDPIKPDADGKGVTASVADIDMVCAYCLESGAAGSKVLVMIVVPHVFAASSGTDSDYTISDGADLIFSGATGESQVLMTDNLADALSVGWNGGDFIVFVTTNSGEKMQLAQDVEIIAGKDLTFVGTTGQSEIHLTDNLADALSVKILSGADFLVFDTTNSSEKLTILSAATQLLGFFGTTPVVQPASTGQTSGFTAGVGTAVLSDSTFTGGSGTKAYTVGDVVKHLKALGLLAAS